MPVTKREPLRQIYDMPPLVLPPEDFPGSPPEMGEPPRFDVDGHEPEIIIAALTLDPVLALCR